jgi:hypothetical protein
MEAKAELEDLRATKESLEEEIAILTNAAHALLRHIPDTLISVAQMDGSIAQHAMPPGSTVLDLEEAIHRDREKAGWVRNDIGPVFIDRSGVRMQSGRMLSDYDLGGTDNVVTMITQRNMRGCYQCWLVLDESNLFHIIRAEFKLEFNEGSVSINGVKGDIADDGDQYIVTLCKSVTLRPTNGTSSCSFDATGCSFKYWASKPSDYAKAMWCPVQGTVSGKLSQRGSKAIREVPFRGRMYKPTQSGIQINT